MLPQAKPGRSSRHMPDLNAHRVSGVAHAACATCAGVL